ncbi:hemagglutinin [Alloscardovia omnicolens]|uniref:hemagglutinin n=1 Tax=Alloscardovia omnicolens TaxID=419015 RepID=UPI003A5DAF00
MVQKKSSSSSTSPTKLSSRERTRTIALWALAIALICALVFGVSKLIAWRQAIERAQSSQSALYAKYDFDPGYIISDDQFFDSDSMTAAEIQSFLEEQGANCTGELCLKNLNVAVSSQAADRECQAYTAPESGTASAAQIIDASARACGISQKVLITILQKEQNLITKTSVTQEELDKALGLSCPDTQACDKNYAGFFKQVYGAAHRFKYYLNHESEYNYHAGALNSIQYSPNAACGANNVYIYNNATAVLYIYTPYQPNAAALAAGAGTGDECSSYGNRNFMIIYTSFFGSPTVKQQ